MMEVLFKLHKIVLGSPSGRGCCDSATFLDIAPVLSSGRFEILHYLREVSISYHYHRYGNLGTREGEMRKPLY